MATQISRDPFARVTVTRESVQPDKAGIGSSCAECGNLNAWGKLFQYHGEHDGGRRYTHTGLFCSKPCHDAWHA